MTENFGWAAEFVLRLKSITLLVRVTRLPQLVKNALDKDNKTTKLKKLALYDGEHWPFSGKEAEWTESKQEDISVWENLLCNIYFLMIKFSRIS